MRPFTKFLVLICCYTFILGNCKPKESKLAVPNQLKSGFYKSLSLLNDKSHICLSLVQYDSNRYYCSVDLFDSSMVMLHAPNAEMSYLFSFTLNNQIYPKIEILQEGSRQVDSIHLIASLEGILTLKIFKKTGEVFMQQLKYTGETTPNVRQYDVSEGRFFLPLFNSPNKSFTFYEFPDSLSKSHVIPVSPKEYLHTVTSISDFTDANNGYSLVYFGGGKMNDPTKYKRYKNHFWIKTKDLYGFFYRDGYRK